MVKQKFTSIKSGSAVFTFKKDGLFKDLPLMIQNKVHFANRKGLNYLYLSTDQVKDLHKFMGTFIKGSNGKKSDSKKPK